MTKNIIELIENCQKAEDELGAINHRLNHICKALDYCVCSVIALEPHEDCPIHGYPLGNRCNDCGRFMKQENSNEL